MKRSSTDPRVPLLVDTDIGSDIDDAVALSYLLRQTRCELAGITTVTGKVAQRAVCAHAVCQAAGRGDVPIATGASTPLLSGKSQLEVPQFAAIESMSGQPGQLGGSFPGDAVGLLRSTIRARPGEITLLAIGPLTNIALLFALDPEIPSLLKAFVAMGGSFFEPMRTYVPAEYNLRADPIASAMVFNRVYPNSSPFTAIGLDVTGQCCLEPEEVRHRFTAAPLDIALTMAEVWFKGAINMAFHDPLAATVIFEPNLCQYQTGSITIATDGDHPGASVFTPDPDGPHRVATEVDSSAFFRHFFAQFETETS